MENENIELYKGVKEETKILKESILNAILRFHQNTGLLVDSFKVNNYNYQSPGLEEIYIKIP